MPASSFLSFSPFSPFSSSAMPPAARRRSDWLVPTGLILLSFVPVAAGASRVGHIAGGAPRTPDNARFIDTPVPIVLHIVSIIIFSLLGAWQFSPRSHRRGRRWHRVAGRLVVPSGLVAALSGLWMSVYYPRPVGDGDVLEALRVVFGSAMAVSLVVGFAAARKRDFARHRIWMTRGYAIGLGAGTQVFTQGPWMLAFGQPGVGVRAALMGAGWVINIAVVEMLFRRSRRRSRSFQLMDVHSPLPSADSIDR